MNTPVPETTELHTRLRLAREQAGLSQGQVAKMMNLHRPTISEIEAGRRKVSAEELVEFAQIYKVSVSWLTAQPSSMHQAKLELAARELSKLKPEDLDQLLNLLAMLHREDNETA